MELAPDPPDAASQHKEGRQDAPLSLSDIKQARNERKRGRALKSGRQLTAGLLSERLSRVGRDTESQEGLFIALDGEQLNHIPTNVQQMMLSATHLNLAHNSFVDLPDLAALTKLQSLTLAHNSITQVFGLRALSRLVDLDISSNLVSSLDASELPSSLTHLQLQDNPISLSRLELVAELLTYLPKLVRLDDKPLVLPNTLQDRGSEESSESTNELVDSAIVELKKAESLIIEGQIAALPRRSPSASNLDRLSQAKRADEPPSPVRVAAVSRQASADLSRAPSSEALEVIARVREALPRLREASDVSFQSQLSENLDLQSASRSFDGTESAFRRLNSEIVQAKERAISVPIVQTRSFLPRHSLGSGKPGSSKDNASFPRSSPPPSYHQYPVEFQKLLSLAISTLVGSGGPPRETATMFDGTDVSVWEQSQLQRQQVLDSLFAKRAQKESSLAGKDRLSSETQDKAEPKAESNLRSRASLRRADSTISKHRRGRGGTGSTINEEMLKGLGLRDAPRAEVLSEALQGPPIQPPGDQLAALSQNGPERATAEGVRMSLRRGFQKMLDNMQKQREKDPADVAAVVGEIKRLCKMKSMQKLLAVKGGHTPPQPQVLASIVGSHSRLGSITDHIAKTMPTYTPLDTDEGKLTGSDRTQSVHAYDKHAPGQKELSSPFDEQPASFKQDNAGSTQNPPAQEQQPPRTPTSSSSAVTSASSSSGEQKGPRVGRNQAPVRRLGPADGKPGLQRNPSQRRQLRPQPPPSPGSDTEPEPPVDRQSARPIFGGIAKMVRAPSGQADIPSSSLPTRVPSDRSLGAKAKKAAAAAKPQASQSTGGSNKTDSAEATDLEKQGPASAGPSPSVPQTGKADQSQNPSRRVPEHEQVSRPRGLESLSPNFNPELWNRFSGRGETNVRQVKRSSEDTGPKKSAFYSPFSAVSTVAASPFSSASTAPGQQNQSQSMQMPKEGWSRSGQGGISPFLRGHADSAEQGTGFGSSAPTQSNRLSHEASQQTGRPRALSESQSAPSSGIQDQAGAQASSGGERGVTRHQVGSAKEGSSTTETAFVSAGPAGAEASYDETGQQFSAARHEASGLTSELSTAKQQGKDDSHDLPGMECTSPFKEAAGLDDSTNVK